VRASPPGVKPVDHVVLSRERLLRTGEKINVNGSVSYDIEAKGDWVDSKGEIRVIDGKTLGIRWKPTLLGSVFHSMEGDGTSIMTELGKWEEEETVKGGPEMFENGLQDGWHQIDIPEIFSTADRLRIPHLTERVMKEADGFKAIERETKLVYIPE